MADPLTKEEAAALRRDLRRARERGHRTVVIETDVAERIVALAARSVEPCGYCGSVDGLAPPNDWHNDPLTGDTLRAAISAACELINPRLSEVDWDAVAAHWSIAVVRDHAEAFGFAARSVPAGDERLREALNDGPWQQLSEAATPGPWAATTTPGVVTGHLTANGRNIADMRYRNGHADAALIVAAVNAVRAALAEPREP